MIRSAQVVAKIWAFSWAYSAQTVRPPPKFMHKRHILGMSTSPLNDSHRPQLQYTGNTDAKNDGSEFWNSNCDFREFFENFKKASHGVPLRPIWTIMVAAKLDRVGSLWPKFHQNRLTLKVEVPVRDTHTDRQTDKRLKIIALQVCNRAKKWQTKNTHSKLSTPPYYSMVG